jgi:hypothetical protein
VPFCPIVRIIHRSYASLSLTGTVEFSTSSTGAFNRVDIWNTDGNTYNLYVTTPNTGINGGFLNPGSQANINFNLTPGTYQFYMFGSPGNNQLYYGLNLFFNGNTSNPAISVFAPLNTSSSSPAPSFTANSNAFTGALGNIGYVQGSSSLVYTSGTYTVTLKDYSWSSPSVYGLDRVTTFNSVPDGTSDYVGSFTLQVVPLPGAVWLLGSGLFGLIGIRRRMGSL